MNLIGLPVTAFKTSAPRRPRASPSSFVRIAPGDLQRLVKVRRHIDRLLARAASRTSRISCGWIKSRKRTSSCTSGSSICNRPAVVEEESVAVVLPGELQRLRAIFQNIRFPVERKNRDPICRPRVSN